MNRPIETIEVEPGVFVPRETSAPPMMFDGPGSWVEQAQRLTDFFRQARDGIETIRTVKNGLQGELDGIFQPIRQRAKPKANPRPTGSIPNAEKVP